MSVASEGAERNLVSFAMKILDDIADWIFGALGSPDHIVNPEADQQVAVPPTTATPFSGIRITTDTSSSSNDWYDIKHWLYPTDINRRIREQWASE